MGYTGSIDAHKRNDANRAMSRQSTSRLWHRRRAQEVRTLTNQFEGSENPKFVSKSYSELELLELRKTIRKKIRKERNFQLFKAVMIGALLIYGALYLLSFMDSYLFWAR